MRKESKRSDGQNCKVTPSFMALFKPLSNILLLLHCRISFKFFFSFFLFFIRMALLFEMHTWNRMREEQNCECVIRLHTHLFDFCLFGWPGWIRGHPTNERTNTHFYLSNIIFHISTDSWQFSTSTFIFVFFCSENPTLCTFDELMYVSFGDGVQFIERGFAKYWC